MSIAFITLLTDFGTRDEYVGVLKGVIYGINPLVRIVDLTHDVVPQDIVGAAYLLKSAYTYFPAGSIHVAVVDPGVGSHRRIIAARVDAHVFLVPDNGLLTPILAHHTADTLVEVEDRRLFRQPVSRTFHGRDIFAPVAANISLEHPLNKLGRTLTVGQLAKLPVTEPQLQTNGKIRGVVIAVDRFGNLITNIEVQHIPGLGEKNTRDGMIVHIGDKRIAGLKACYADVYPGVLLAIIGSRNCLEIAVSKGNAAQTLKAGQGTPVEIIVKAGV